MTGFNHHYNTDQTVIRYAIVGLLRYFNKTIKYSYRISDNEVKNVDIAFLYDLSGQERLYQDFYVQPGWSDCNPDFIEGNYEIIPRGMLKLGGINIASTESTNRFVRAKYTIEQNGSIETRNAQLNSIPLLLSFNLELICDSLNESLGITEKIIETLYKNIVFHINYNGFIIPCRAGLSDSYDISKAVEISYTYNEPTKIILPIEMSTFKPIVDMGSDRLDSNRIYTFKHNYTAGKETEHMILTSQDLEPLNNNYIIYNNNISGSIISDTKSDSIDNNPC